jgi:hypothetical protein
VTACQSMLAVEAVEVICRRAARLARKTVKHTQLAPTTVGVRRALAAVAATGRVSETSPAPPVRHRQR